MSLHKNKILIIGHSPSSKEYCPRKGNPSINRLNRWLDACDVRIYSYSNACAHHAPSLKKGNIDKTYLQNIAKNYNKILVLGKEVEQLFTKMRIEHFALPHPSPLNRKLNDKNFEKSVINGLHSYINGV